MVLPSGFIEPCQPPKVARPLSGPLWVHEVRHDGYRLIVQREAKRVRLFIRNGHDWSNRDYLLTGHAADTANSTRMACNNHF